MAADDVAPVYFRVSPAIWRQRWSDHARYLALYLLTCSHRTIEGYYVLPKPYICGDMKWTAEALAEPFAELRADGFFQYDEDEEVCLMPKALLYQPPTNPNMSKAAIKRVQIVPCGVLDTAFMESAKRYAEPFAKALAEALPERFGEPYAKGYGKPLLFSSLPNSALPRASASDCTQPLARVSEQEVAQIKDLAAATAQRLRAGA